MGAAYFSVSAKLSWTCSVEMLQPDASSSLMAAPGIRLACQGLPRLQSSNLLMTGATPISVWVHESLSSAG